MEFIEKKLYHIYNRGNNQQTIFFSSANYLYFLAKVRRYIQKTCDILSYSLLPNHFNFVIYADNRTIQTRLYGKEERNVLSEAIRNLLSSYAQGINKQNRWTGSLFQQNTKSKCLNEGDQNYGQFAFHYVHQNAFEAGLVTKMEDWRYSSFPDYVGLRNGSLCNQRLAYDILGLNPRTMYEDSYSKIPPGIIYNIH